MCLSGIRVKQQQCVLTCSVTVHSAALVQGLNQEGISPFSTHVCTLSQGGKQLLQLPIGALFQYILDRFNIVSTAVEIEQYRFPSGQKSMNWGLYGWSKKYKFDF